MKFENGLKSNSKWMKSVQSRIDKLVPIELSRRFRPIRHNLLVKRSAEMNRKRFRSEVLFMKLMRSYFPDLTLLRNHPICNRFFGDFVSLEYSFVIEIDGSSHQGKEEYDRLRDQFLESFGFQVLRLKMNSQRNWLVVAHSFIAKQLAKNISMEFGIRRSRRRSVFLKKTYKSSTYISHMPPIRHVVRPDLDLIMEESINS